MRATRQKLKLILFVNVEIKHRVFGKHSWGTKVKLDMNTPFEGNGENTACELVIYRQTGPYIASSPLVFISPRWTTGKIITPYGPFVPIVV